VVDQAMSSPPAVAQAPDGTGIVAWTHNRRVYAVSIAQGKLGRVERLAASNGIDSLVVAACPGGEATVAWMARLSSRRRYEVRALRRFAGRAFGPVRVLRSTQAFVGELVLAADERGRTTAAWPEHDFGNPAGENGVTSSVHTTTPAPGHLFRASRAVTTNGRRSSRSLSIAGANGRVAVAWGHKRDSRHVGVEAVAGPPSAPGPVQTVAAVTVIGDFFVTTPSARATLSASGAATVLAVVPPEPAPKQIATRLIAADGP
jgi:hypothetical protein